MRRLAFLSVVMASLFCCRSAPAEEKLPWTADEGTRVFIRLSQQEAFPGSGEFTRYPETLHRFFGAAEYGLLLGNPFLGYWSSGRFAWVGQTVAFDGIRAATPGAHAISAKAWQAAFAYVAKKYGLIVSPKARVRIRGACVAAVVDPTPAEPTRGVTVEVRVDSPTGPLLARLSIGKPTIEDAVGASLDLIVAYALRVNRPEGKSRER